MEERLPNVALVINAVIGVCAGKKSKEQAVKEILAEYKDVVTLRIETTARQEIDDMIRNAPEKGVRELSQKDFSDRLVVNAKMIAANVNRFYRHEISPQQFVESCRTGALK